MSDTSGTLPPRQIILHRQSRTLEIVFAEGHAVTLPAAWLRAHSPSADNRRERAHKPEVGILAVEPVGHYAVKLLFSDGHRSGLYSWDTLHALARQYRDDAT